MSKNVQLWCTSKVVRRFPSCRDFGNFGWEYKWNTRLSGVPPENFHRKGNYRKNVAARRLLKLYNSVNLPNFRQSPSLAAILRDLSTWSVADINRAGRSKTVRNTYESIQMNFTFNSSGKIWNCSLNLPFLHPHATISSNNWNTICN